MRLILNFEAGLRPTPNGSSAGIAADSSFSHAGVIARNSHCANSRRFAVYSAPNFLPFESIRWLLRAVLP